MNISKYSLFFLHNFFFFNKIYVFENLKISTNNIITYHQSNQATMVHCICLPLNCITCHPVPTWSSFSWGEDLKNQNILQIQNSMISIHCGRGMGLVSFFSFFLVEKIWHLLQSFFIKFQIFHWKFSPKLKEKITMFLHIVQASSQDIKGF